MNTKIIYIILVAISLVWFTWWWVAQNKVNNAERIIEIDRQLLDLDYKDQQADQQIKIRQANYKIHMDAALECQDSFIKQAEEEHLEADSWRDEKTRIASKKAELENEKAGLIQNR